jgi:N-acetylmuramoyl-L-alanine amidase
MFSQKISAFLLALLFTVSGATALHAQSQLSFTAQKGDGIYAVLAKYRLDRHPCNFDEFLRLNKLKANSYLVVNKSYLLPIKVYTYNGTSIRTSIGNNDLAKAKNIELYNDKMLEEKLKKGDFRKDKVLWVPFGELNCPPVEVVDVPQERTFPIFGKDHQNVVLKDKVLLGAIYYLVSGHGGPDPGAMGRDGKHVLCEDEYAYDVILRLAKNLLEHGATVYIIVRDPNDGIRSEQYLKADTDEVCWPAEGMSVHQKSRLTQQSNVINALYEEHKTKGARYQRAVNIHVDSRTKGERIDLFFYHKENDEAGRKMANAMHNIMKAKYAQHRKNGNYYGTVSARDLHMLREVKPVTVFIELANIRNPLDQQRIIQASNRQAVANWLYEGLLKDYK